MTLKLRVRRIDPERPRGDVGPADESPDAWYPVGDIMRTISRYLIAAFMATLLSCRVEGVLPPLPPESNDDPVLQAVYSSYRVPPGFYQEDLTNSNLYYENTISITPGYQRGDTGFELCTDDHNLARAWSDSSNAYGSDNRAVIAERETERFFEFTRADASKWKLLSRVHKCTYLDRSMLDRFHPGSVIGVFNKRPMSQIDVQSLVEYLWFLDNYDIGGEKILSVESADNGSVFQTILTETQVSYGDWGMRDRITVFLSAYAVNKTDGTITLNKTIQRTLEGHLN